MTIHYLRCSQLVWNKCFKTYTRVLFTWPLSWLSSDANKLKQTKCELHLQQLYHPRLVAIEIWIWSSVQCVVSIRMPFAATKCQVESQCSLSWPLLQMLQLCQKKTVQLFKVVAMTVAWHGYAVVVAGCNCHSTGKHPPGVMQRLPSVIWLYYTSQGMHLWWCDCSDVCCFSVTVFHLNLCLFVGMQAAVWY